MTVLTLLVDPRSIYSALYQGAENRSNKKAVDQLQKPGGTLIKQTFDLPKLKLLAITITIHMAKALGGLGFTTIWRLLKEKRLQVVRVDGRTLVVFRSFEESRRAKARSNGRDCRAERSPPTRCGSSFMRPPTTSAISCGRWRRRSRSRTGR